ncbi:hypothetical protein SAY86_021309 [Trapa natans]|uniref:Pectinesterase inhibitor domain-containing protein n=1 Tax=Trapa natans TaxID=22666 RepID=A0AAN7REP3_TRANT|nr:hypothetical protein SAY86_021309 [Trapa natans]
MESSSRVSLFFLLLGMAVGLALYSPAATATETKLVSEVCRNTTSVRYSDCLEALNNPRADNITDIRDLAFLSLDLAIANSSEAVRFLHDQITHASPELGPVLKLCYTNLESSYTDFLVAVPDLKADPMIANYDVFVALDGVNFCRNNMQEANVSIPEVERRCAHVQLFVRICDTTTNSFLTTYGRGH